MSLPPWVEAATPDVLLEVESEKMLMLRYEEHYLSVEFPIEECLLCGEEVRHQETRDRFRGRVELTCTCGKTRVWWDR